MSFVYCWRNSIWLLPNWISRFTCTTPPARAAGAYLVIVGGRAAAYLERGGKSLVTFEDADEGAWLPTLVSMVREWSIGSLEIAKVDGQPFDRWRGTDAAIAAGFSRGYKGLTLRPAR